MSATLADVVAQLHNIAERIPVPLLGRFVDEPPTGVVEQAAQELAPLPGEVMHVLDGSMTGAEVAGALERTRREVDSAMGAFQTAQSHLVSARAAAADAMDRIVTAIAHHTQ